MDAIPVADLDALRQRLATVFEQVSAICHDLGVRPAGSPATAAPEPRAPTHTPEQMAQQLYADRRRRTRHLPPTLFGEPAWDILLDLFIAAERGLDISVTSACIAADVPSTTGLRWLHILEGEGLVKSEADTQDGRRRFIRLTPDAHTRMRAFFGEESAPSRARTRESGLFADLV